MNQITYHYAEPQDILRLDDKTFEHLMHSNIYRINSKFVENQQCMDRLLKFIKNMETSIKNLKLVRDLMRTFQSSILFFLQGYYTNSDQNFMEVLKIDASDSQKIVKNKGKVVNLLKEISLIYKKITDGTGKIEEFEFFNKYGTSQKQMSFSRNNPQLQSRYLWFLKRCFQEEIKMKDPNIPPKSKLQSLEVLEKQFKAIMNDQEFYYLEEATFKTIRAKFTSIIQSTKHAGNSLRKNDIPQSTFKKEKKQKTQIHPDDLEAVRNISPCCRAFFYQNQPIHHAESFTLEYKNYQSPYDKFCVTNIKRAICGFLNRDGGIILVGIFERDEDKFRQVKGQFLSENEKEEVIKEYRGICGQIFPNIVGQSKYAIKFVPIKTNRNNYVAGKYVVRVEVSAGHQRSLYTYKDMKNQYVALRTANQVLKREINQQILTIFKQRLLNPKQIQPIHERPCPQPQIGDPTWEKRSIYDKNKNYDKKRNNKRNYEERSDQNSSDDSKKGKKLTWTEKLQRSSALKKDKNQSDFVYFSQKPNEFKQLDDEQTGYRYKFICDDDDDKDIRKKQSDSQKNEQPKEKEENDDDLDFRPLNPVTYRRKPEQRPRRPIHNMPRQEILHVQEPNQINRVPYKLQGVLVNKEANQKPISETKCLDILIVGYPHEMVKDLVKNFDLKLVEDPVYCNDFTTWLKISRSDAANYDKYQLFNRQLMIRHAQMKIDKPLKLRKLYSNLVFQNQILLNKLIHKFKHDQEFTDRDGCIFYNFKNNVEAIQGYMIGSELNIKMKFISDSDMKKQKLEYLKFKAEIKL